MGGSSRRSRPSCNAHPASRSRLNARTKPRRRKSLAAQDLKVRILLDGDSMQDHVPDEEDQDGRGDKKQNPVAPGLVRRFESTAHPGGYSDGGLSEFEAANVFRLDLVGSVGHLPEKQDVFVHPERFTGFVLEGYLHLTSVLLFLPEFEGADLPEGDRHQALSAIHREIQLAVVAHVRHLNDDAFEVFHGGIESLLGYRHLLPGGRLAEHAHTEKERYEDHQVPEADHPSPDHVSPSPFVKSDHARSLLPAGTCLLP